MSDLIDRLSEIRSQYNCFDEAERLYYHALSEAIKVLSGQADGDTISRQDAIDAVTSLCDVCKSDYCGSCRVNYPGEKDCRKVLEDLPPAQPDITEKLYQYKCYITDKEGLQHEVIYMDDIRRVTGWEI